MSGHEWDASWLNGVTNTRRAEQLPEFWHTTEELAGVLTRAELSHLPAVQPLIENTLDRRTLAVLAGYWGTGKSFLAWDWACSIATGHPWMGRPIDVVEPPHPNRVLVVVGEGAYGVHERITAWEIDHGTEVRDLFVLPRAINLLSRIEVAQVAEFVYANNIDLVVLDTLSRCMPGADENSAADMSKVVQHLDVIKEARKDEHGDDYGGTCVLVVHHTGKDRTTIRGSSVLEGAADTVYQVDGDGQSMRLQRTKRKDGPRDDLHQLAIRWVPGTDSASVRSLSAADKLQNADILLSAYMSAFAQTGASKAELRNIVDMAPASFHRALNTLVKDGRLVNTGTEKRPFYKAGDP